MSSNLQCHLPGDKSVPDSQGREDANFPVSVCPPGSHKSDDDRIRDDPDSFKVCQPVTHRPPARPDQCVRGRAMAGYVMLTRVRL